MAKKRKPRKPKAKKKSTKKSGRKSRSKGAKVKRKTVLSVKSGKGSATMELKGLKPVAGTASYGVKNES